MPTTSGVTAELGLAALRAPEGCVAYLVWDPATREALAIDPRLDQIEELLEAARPRGAQIRMVFDTHTHADHLSGARRLAERAKAELLAPAGSGLKAPARRVAPGSTFMLGKTTVSVLAAPGHTPDSAALLINGQLFTGDALFLEGVGRTDFPGGSPEDLIKTLERFEALPGETVVRPGHDYQKLGSATLEELRSRHPVLAERDRQARVARVSGKGASIPDIRHFLAWNLAEKDPQELSARVSQALFRGRSAALVDVRTPDELRETRIEGALAAPLADLEKFASNLPKDVELIIVCRSGMRSKTAKDILARRGIASVVMEGGIMAWQAAGLPVVGARSGAISIDRQVQITAGSLVFFGVLLGAFVSPWALILPGFVGAGLIFAGATGTCGMATCLGWLPWNRPSKAAAAPSCSAPASSCSAGSAPPASACSAPVDPPKK